MAYTEKLNYLSLVSSVKLFRIASTFSCDEVNSVDDVKVRGICDWRLEPVSNREVELSSSGKASSDG